MKMQDMPKNVLEEIQHIYADDKKKIRQTFAITRKLYAKEIESNELTCPICGKTITNIKVVHAVVHDYANRTTNYWKKENLVPMCSQECHEKDDIETYLVGGEKYCFSKSETGMEIYRGILNGVYPEE